MPVAPHIARLRAQVGHDLLLLPSVTVLPLDEDGRVLLVRQIDFGLFGTIGGVGLGTFLGWGLMRALGAQEGFSGFAVPTTSLAIVVALAALAGVVAAWRPARRAGRLDILAAIATD